MYAFGQRDDTTVLDEPLYASYLRLTGHDRPYRDLVGALACPFLLTPLPMRGGKRMRESVLPGFVFLRV